MTTGHDHPSIDGRKGRSTDVTRRINDAQVSPVELREYLEACLAKRLPGDEYHNFWMQISTAGGHTDHEPDRTLALYYRARAMALVVSTNDGVPSWTFSTAADQAPFAHYALFAAAAAEPLSTDDAGEFVFDRVKFLKRVFELAQPAVSQQ